MNVLMVGVRACWKCVWSYASCEYGCDWSACTCSFSADLQDFIVSKLMYIIVGGGGIQLLQLDTFKQLFMAFDGMHLLRMCCLNCQAIWLLRASCTHWLSQAGLVTCLQGFNRAGAMLAPTMHCVNSLTFVSILIIGTVHT